MALYTTRDAARLLGLPAARVRRLARAALPGAARRHGELRFSFQDLVLLRATKGLIDSRVPARRVRRALRRLAAQLPAGRPLSAVQLEARGERIVARHGDSVWQPDSGQGCLVFDEAARGRRVARHTPPAAAEGEAVRGGEEQVQAEDWYALGCDVERVEPERARDAYRRCLELDPDHVDARINLGRLLHEAGRNVAAEAQLRLALTQRPEDPTATFDLGVVVEDLERLPEALELYRRAIAADPACADAYYNAARLYEKLGDDAAALCHLKTYRRLTRDH